MLRKISTLFFLLAVSVLSAQDHGKFITDTPEMAVKAKERTEMVARTVGELSKEQTARIEEVYLQVERQVAMFHKRMEGQPEADVKADMKHMYASTDAYADKQLAEILNEKQLALWKESTK